MAGAVGRRGQGSAGVDSHHPTRVVAAIAVMSAVGDVEDAGLEGQRPALVLDHGAETRDGRIEIDRRPRDGPVQERDGEHAVVPAGRHRVDEQQPAPGIDDRRARDPERIDVAAGQLRLRGGRGQRARPAPRTGERIECDHLVALGGDDQEVLPAVTAVPVQRLRINGALERRVEAAVLAQAANRGSCQRRIDVDAGSRRVVVVLQDGGARARRQLIGRRRLRLLRAGDGDGPEHPDCLHAATGTMHAVGGQWAGHEVRVV